MKVLEIASQIARLTYTNEFCTACGRAITRGEAKTTIISDEAGNKISKAAHQDCSAAQQPSSSPTTEKTWSFPSSSGGGK